MNTLCRTLAVVALATTLGACAATSSSEPAGAVGQAWQGKVFVTESAVPTNARHQVLGTVRANAPASYSSGTTLYPMLADEARKLGANAVVDVTGGRRVSMWSWASPFVSGTAVRIEGASALNGLPGENY